MWLALAMPTWAQYGRLENTKKTAPTVRAIAVLEWTGEMGKPKASRIIPISVFDGEQYQPGGLYLAKPEPLALQPGTEYVLQDAGIARESFDINTAQDVDGYWFGYGAWKPMATPPRRQSRSKADTSPRWLPMRETASLTSRAATKWQLSVYSSTSGSTSSSSGSTNSTASSNPPAGDPDRPTLRRRSDSSESAPAASASSADAAAPEIALGGADPDRPHMAHGQQTPKDDIQPAQLTGVPSGLQQMIAVSDAGDREAHPFVYLWSDPADADKMKQQMEIAAANAIASRGAPGEDRSAAAHRNHSRAEA